MRKEFRAVLITAAIFLCSMSLTASSSNRTPEACNVGAGDMTWCGRIVTFYSDATYTTPIGTYKVSPQECGCEVVESTGSSSEHHALTGTYSGCGS